MNESKIKLSNKEEELLIGHFDGELSLFQNFLAKRLLQSNPLAREYFGSLKEVAASLRSFKADINVNNKVDLWDRIERRIDQEERAEFFLGTRDTARSELPTSNWFGQFVNKSVFGGMTVGLATAAVAFVALDNRTESTPNISLGNSVAVINEASQVRFSPFVNSDHNVANQVEYASFSDSSAYQSLAQKKVSSNNGFRNQKDLRTLKRMEIPFKVDWMRSDGQVSFIQDPRRGSTVIWVNKGSQNPSRPIVLEAEPKLVTSPLDSSPE